MLGKHTGAVPDCHLPWMWWNLPGLSPPYCISEVILKKPLAVKAWEQGLGWKFWRSSAPEGESKPTFAQISYSPLQRYSNCTCSKSESFLLCSPRLNCTWTVTPTSGARTNWQISTYPRRMASAGVQMWVCLALVCVWLLIIKPYLSLCKST